MIQIGSTPATIDTPVEHLMACHRRIEQRLETLVQAADHLAVDRLAALDAIRHAQQFLDTSGALHTEDEEVSLFPRLREKISLTELIFVDSLEKQHTHAEAIYTELKRLSSSLAASSDAPADSIRAYLDCATRLRDLYLDHIQAEDRILTAIARRSLSQSELAAISGEMRSRRAKPL